ncbi:polysaccharide biosynthesis tyrosine autokinase [Microbacterium terrisoli]|uniref:polysaccharide biosynthesis tyrosine autokinase n=1 Tax=Microbacterium terrisoli TaxID=3242192 RepID=UPI0028059D1D|nr:polysaccharide biosynthesis tyrosine autokinase [Microbacterium protaetiae]
MELSDYIHILRKHWIAIALITLLGIGVAAGYSLTRTPQYEASSTVVVSTQTGDSIADLQQGNSFTLARVNTYTNLVTTPSVMVPVIDKLKLNTTVTKLTDRVSATSPLNTTLITITATDPSPMQAANIANALAASLTATVEKIESPSGAKESPVRLTTVAEAQAPSAPSSPKVLLNLALGLLIGLALGIGFAVMRSVLDTRVRTPRDVAQVTDAPLIGAIADDPKAPERPLIVHADPLSPRAESFRTLRTNLQFLDMGGRASFVITSSMPSEGKSTTAINLAIALADAGKKVALLDTDLRKPKVAEYLGIEGGVGLTDVLIGHVRVGDVMLPWGGRSLYVMPAGKVPPNPSELLGSQQMHTLLAALERDFDVVLCDAPPLLPVTDGAILAKATSGAIVIAAAGTTTRNQLSNAIDALDTVDAKTAGVVLTKVPTRGPDAYYTYGYGYMQDETAHAQAVRPAHRRHSPTSALPPQTPLAKAAEQPRWQPAQPGPAAPGTVAPVAPGTMAPRPAAPAQGVAPAAAPARSTSSSELEELLGIFDAEKPLPLRADHRVAATPPTRSQYSPPDAGGPGR